jgi:hypothetical protein
MLLRAKPEAKPQQSGEGVFLARQVSLVRYPSILKLVGHHFVARGFGPRRDENELL